MCEFPDPKVFDPEYESLLESVRRQSLTTEEMHTQKLSYLSLLLRSLKPNTKIFRAVSAMHAQCALGNDLSHDKYWIRFDMDGDQFSFNKLIQYADSCPEVQNLLEAKTYFALAEFGSNEQLRIPFLAAAVRLSERMVCLTSKSITSWTDRCIRVLKKQPNDIDALFVMAYIHFLKSNGVGQEHLARSIQLLSNSVFDDDQVVARFRGCMRQTAGLKRESIADFDIALRTVRKGDPEIQTYFLRGDSKMKADDQAGAVADFNTFIALAVGNERKLCEAYYHLAVIAADDGRLWTAKALYEKGMAAEISRCPIYKDGPTSFRKHLDILFTRLFKHRCANAGCESGGWKLCSRCKTVRYCGAQCQLHHWKSGHKGACAKPDE
jgi:tetratricopeptide (TPR) repeat protein